MRGEGNEPVLPPEVELPPPPAIPPVKPGALKRLFRLVRQIKTRPSYTVAIGRELGVEENHYHRESPVPTFRLRAETGPVVVIKYSLFGHQGVYAEFRRNDGEWEPVAHGVLSGAGFRHPHPLLDPAPRGPRVPPALLEGRRPHRRLDYEAALELLHDLAYFLFMGESPYTDDTLQTRAVGGIAP